MKNLIERLSDFFSLRTLASGRPDHSAAGENTTALRAEQRWEDALAACIYDDNARTYLDYLGPRGR